jgi:hypothetical protein
MTDENIPEEPKEEDRSDRFIWEDGDLELVEGGEAEKS